MRFRNVGGRAVLPAFAALFKDSFPLQGPGIQDSLVENRGDKAEVRNLNERRNSITGGARDHEIWFNMNEKVPLPCEHCGATGLSHGSDCRECNGKGYRLIVNGNVSVAAHLDDALVCHENQYRPHYDVPHRSAENIPPRNVRHAADQTPRAA